MNEVDEIRAMSDDDLLAQINAYDPYDAEFARRFRALRAERDAALAKHGDLRMCLSCGRYAGGDHNRALPLPDCPSPDACTFDLTPDEAWQHWRQEYHDMRAERDAALAGE